MGWFAQDLDPAKPQSADLRHGLKDRVSLEGVAAVPQDQGNPPLCGATDGEHTILWGQAADQPIRPRKLDAPGKELAEQARCRARDEGSRASPEKRKGERVKGEGAASDLKNGFIR